MNAAASEAGLVGLYLIFRSTDVTLVQLGGKAIQRASMARQT